MFQGELVSLAKSDLELLKKHERHLKDQLKEEGFLNPTKKNYKNKFQKNIKRLVIKRKHANLIKNLMA